MSDNHSNDNNNQNNDSLIDNIKTFFILLGKQFKKDFNSVINAIKNIGKRDTNQSRRRYDNANIKIETHGTSFEDITSDKEENNVSGNTQIVDKINPDGGTHVVEKITHEKAAENKEAVNSEEKMPPLKQPKRRSIFKTRKTSRSFLVTSILTTVMLVILFVAFLGVIGLGAGLGIANAYVDTTPILDLAKIENLSATSFIYDDKGNLVTTFSGLENRIYAPISEIPDTLQAAFVATEDARFYTHNGVDPKRIVGAFFNNLRTDTTQGGSTITQQLIKLRLLSYEQTYKRKLQEAYLALQLEREYTKDQILESYLNTMDLGAGNYGVKAAAIDYFGKELGELSLRECATLAGIAKSPYLYNPRSNYYKWETPERSDGRTDTVLYRMYQSGYITKEEYNDALNDTVSIKQDSEKQQMYDMPYFLEYAVADVVDGIIDSRNMTESKTNRSLIENELRTKGYHIYTTVDRDMQLTVEDTLYNWDSYPLTMYKSDSTMLVRNSDGTTQEIIQPQASAAVYDFKSGQLKAIVGGRQEPTVRKALNRAYQAPMPVGSSIKPIAVYGPALNNGVSPATVVMDLPLPVDGWISEKGYPSNYGGTFSGPITVRKALMRSVNMAAARLLTDYVGVEESFNTLVDLGINPDYLNKDGSGLSLGTSGITTVDMSVAFGAIGNNGVYIEPVAYSKVVDTSGDVILDSANSQIIKPVFTPSATWLLVDMLEDAVRSGTGRAARFSNMTVAGKTGTNSDYRGVFFAGFTPYYSAAVWVGHDGYEPLSRSAQGGADAAPLWKAFMEEIHEDKDLPDKPILDTTPSELGLVKVKVCAVSGMLATEACNHDASGRTPVTDYFQPGTEPTELCNMHRLVNICTESGKIATPYCPNTETKGVLIVPGDSMINDLDDTQLMTYFKSAIRYLDNPDALVPENYNNTAYAKYFCTIHTQEWYDNTNKMNEAVKTGENLLVEVSVLMSKYKEQMDTNHVEQVNAARVRLRNLVDARTDYDGIIKAIQDLKVLKQVYLDPFEVADDNGG